MHVIIIATLVALLLLATLLPLSHKTLWWIRDLDFPRLQVAVFAVLLLAAQVAFLDLEESTSAVLLAATIACLLYQAWWILPYTRLFPLEVLASSAGDTAERICQCADGKPKCRSIDWLDPRTHTGLVRDTRVRRLVGAANGYAATGILPYDEVSAG